ncbi:MAG: hypothetical protein QNK33_06325, partial [Bacteroidales bacterium]|nr:hypothetical protein [Bacteroidales bacterium]
MKSSPGIFVLFITIILIFQCCTSSELPESMIKVNPQKLPLPRSAFNPEKYVCYMGKDIKIDGKLDETSWQNA